MTPAVHSAAPAVGVPACVHYAGTDGGAVAAAIYDPESGLSWARLYDSRQYAANDALRLGWLTDRGAVAFMGVNLECGQVLNVAAVNAKTLRGWAEINPLVTH